MKRALFLLFLAAAVAAGGLFGQPPPAKAVRQFRVITTVKSIRDLKCDLDNRKACALDIRSTLSQPLPMPASGPLVIYREIAPPPGSPPGTKPVRKTVATLTFPSQLTQAIVVIIAKPDQTYQTRVFADDAKTHPAGSLRVFNLSGMQAALSLGEKVYDIASGRTALAPYRPGPVLVQVAAQKGAAWKIAFRKGRIARDGLRVHLFIFDYEPDPALDDRPPPPVLVRFYTENAPAAPAG